MSADKDDGIERSPEPFGWWPCHSLPKEEWCDRDGPGGFMGHTCQDMIRIREQSEARRLAELHAGQAVRAIGGKTRWDWMPWQALEEVALVFTICQSTPEEHPQGIGKYKPNNWISGDGLPLMGYFRGTVSHCFRFFVLRQTLDDETGLHHLAHAGWNVLCALETVLQGKGIDDRL